MNPTAPQNDLNSEDNQQSSPIQPGQFVVSGETNAPNIPQPNSEIPLTQPQNYAANQANTQAPQANSLASDLESTVAAATGTNLAGEAPSAAPENLIMQGPLGVPPPPSEQPDPTPFVPPTSPQGTGFQQQVPPADTGSKMGKIKLLVIVIGILILIAIIVGVVWFFVLNKKSTPQSNTVQEVPVEEPVLSSPEPQNGFGEIPPTTEEPGESPQQEPVPPQELSPELTTQ